MKLTLYSSIVVTQLYHVLFLCTLLLIGHFAHPFPLLRTNNNEPMTTISFHWSSKMGQKTLLIPHHRQQTSLLSMSNLNLDDNEEDDDDDDGWGAVTPKKEDELNQNLPAADISSSSLNSNNNNKYDNYDPTQERDLFIPIFTLVSLAGFFGSYGYEMLRLYSRGELYLPWENN